MRRIGWILIGLVVVTLVAAVLFRSRWGMQSTTTPAAASSAVPPGSAESARRSSVWALGRLEPADGVISLGALPGDRLVELHVKEGGEISPDPEKPWGKLESETALELEVESLQTQLKEASEQAAVAKSVALAKLKAAKIAEQQAGAQGKAEAEAQAKKAVALRAALAQADKDLERVTKLAQQSAKLVSAQEVERQQLVRRQALAEVEAADAALRAVQVTADFGQQLAVAEREAAELAVAQAERATELTALKQQLRAAQQRRDRARLIAPIRGRVLRVFAQVGETLGQQPILQVADTSRMVCIAEVSHDQLQHVAKGQRVRIRSRAFGVDLDENALEGTVASISTMALTPALRPTNPLAAADRLTLEVRVELDPRSARVARQFIHLQVDVEFQVAASPAGSP